MDREDIIFTVFDNLSVLTPSMIDENASVQFTKVNDFISLLKREGRTVLVVHHANKEGFSYRGSAKQGVIHDSIIQLALLDNSFSDEGITRFRLVFEKSRAKRVSAMANRVVSMSSFGFSSGDEKVLAQRMAGDVHLQKVVRIVQQGEHQRLTQRRIADVFGMNAQTVYRRVVTGLELGMLTSEQVVSMFSRPPPDVLDAIEANAGKALKAEGQAVGEAGF